MSKDSIGFPKEIFGSPKGVICVSKDSIGFPKEIFGSSKEVSQFRIRVRQMMYVDQFEVFCWTDRSITYRRIKPMENSKTVIQKIAASGRFREAVVYDRF